MSSLAGTRRLVRLVLRRERVALPIWIIWLGMLPSIMAGAFRGLYASFEAVRSAATAIAANPGLTALFGPIFDFSIGGLVAWRIGSLGALGTGLMSLLTVTRHTRAEEEAGRSELLGSTVVGRQAGLAAAVIVALVASALIGLLVAATLAAADLPPTGSAALGLSFALTGWVFAGVAAGTAQLTESARTARGLALAILGASLLVRIMADASAGLSWFVWLTPLGWAQRLLPFAGERWWVGGIAFLAAAASATGAFVLSSRRDLGAGVLGSRSGPAVAVPRLRSPLALAWRLQRGSLLGWSVGMGVFAVVIGGITPGLADLAKDSPELQDILERLGGTVVITDAFLASVMGIFGLVAAAYAISAVLRLRSEEIDIHAEPLLATAVTRLRWILSHVVFGILGPVLLLAVVGLAAGAAYGFGVGDPAGEIPRLVGAALAQLPAVWILGGLTAALFGLLPRLVQVGWGVLAAAVVLLFLGAILRLDQWILDLSPFTHIPKLPGGSVSPTPLVWLTAAACALLVAGSIGIGRRDIG